MTEHPCRRARQQRGISLIVVMVMLLLGTILVLGATRTNWLNESLVNNESDYQRAYSAAEALMADAETDIRGTLVGLVPCRAGAGFDGCRNRAGGRPFFPMSSAGTDLDELETNMGGQLCREGICWTPNYTDGALGVAWWNDPARVTAMTAAGVPATYGQFTLANQGGAGNSDNPLLRVRGNGAFGGWYWVEVMEYNIAAGAMGAGSVPNVPIPADTQPFVYRITVMVNGLKPGTRVVLRSVFVPNVSNTALP